MQKWTIHEKAKKKSAKSRQFAANCLMHIEADCLWDGGQTLLDGNGRKYNAQHRPVFMVLAGTTGELRPFVANLRTGRYAVASGLTAYRHDDSPKNRYEVLKSASFQVHWQRKVGRNDEALCTIFHPTLFELSPGLLDEGSDVCFLTPPLPLDKEMEAYALLNDDDRKDVVGYARAARLIDSEANLLGIGKEWDEEKLINLVPRAQHFAACLMHRIFIPFPVSPSFCLHLYFTMLRHGLASLPHDNDRWRSYGPWAWAKHRGSFAGFTAHGLEFAGMAPPVACMTTHEAVETFLAEQIRFFNNIYEVTHHGTH